MIVVHVKWLPLLNQVGREIDVPHTFNQGGSLLLCHSYSFTNFPLFISHALFHAPRRTPSIPSSFLVLILILILILLIPPPRLGGLPRKQVLKTWFTDENKLDGLKTREKGDGRNGKRMKMKKRKGNKGKKEMRRNDDKGKKEEEEMKWKWRK